MLPAAVQPPDPCNLLTAADVTSLVGPIAYPPKDSALATIHDPGRGCEWPVVLHRVDASGTARDVEGHVSVAIMTAGARGASNISGSQLSVLFSQDASFTTEISVAGYPARHWGNSGPAGYLEVLTPTALITVGVQGVNDLATLTKLAQLAVGRANSTGS